MEYKMSEALFFGLVSCFVVMSEGRYLIPDLKDIAQENVDYGNGDDDFCPILLTKPLTALLISEYNRVASTNQRYYMQSSDQAVTCKTNDITSCHVTLDLTASTCYRLSPSKNCEPTAQGIIKKCRGGMDLIRAEVTEALQCWSVSDDIPQVNRNIKMLAANPAPQGLYSARPRGGTAINVFKKKWDEDDGNHYPF